MNVSIGEVVTFGPPGSTKVRGKVIKLGHPKVKIRQLVAGHGQSAGTEWWVPLSDEYITQTFGALPKPVPPEKKPSGYHTPTPRRTSKKRTSRPPPAPRAAAVATGGGLSESWALGETKALLERWTVPAFHIQFSNAMTRTLGVVNYRRRTITYSRPLWVRATDEQRREVVIHEVAHAVVENRLGRQRGVSHGAPWKAQMVAMGIKNPSAYHTVKRDDLHRKRADTVELMCCGTHKLRMTLAKLFRSTRVAPDGSLRILLRCKRCKEAPTLLRSDAARFEEYVRRGGAAPLRPNQICGCSDH